MAKREQKGGAVINIPLAKWDEAKREPSSSEDDGTMYYYPVAGLFGISGAMYFGPDLVRLKTPNILEQYLISLEPEASPPPPPATVRSMRRPERVLESYAENISNKYRFSLDPGCIGPHKCLIVVNHNYKNNSSCYRPFNFIYLTTLRSSAYFTQYPSVWAASPKLYDASDVWTSKYHVDRLNPSIAKLRLFILYLNVYLRLLRIANNNNNNDLPKKNLLAGLPKEILSKIAWVAVHS